MAAIALIFAAPAMAQDHGGYDPDILWSCLDVRADTPDACIGIAAARCSDSSTAGMVSCLSAETDQWDNMLNDAYQVAMAESEAADAEAKALGMTTPETAPLLRDAQRAWMAWRDATCAYAGAVYQGGTAAAPAVQNCVMDMTARQALAMRGQGPAE
ncbi:lysozyme inhibitor LprI family protein [Paracoccus sp. (in: a-proteobacteria)]|uniref:lysozyme inhibitor LprI family protein n=1 Tax=Paracoccus sp. TaxID=267 RepID=UPI0026E05CE5|nr:lysozyme inhibitor LprI family protein [Paracoccus sp. (in: a-proteobacteria)]MDO5646445.1 lysozyme inhibitor LprI family protein [Paracoccus sp. (in: a-proteobacteria)]